MKKLKQQYQVVKREICTYTGREYTYHPRVRDGMHRSFSTKQERAFYYLHKAEYHHAYPMLKLRPSRGSALPNEWDDLPSFRAQLTRSWKHNSKRKNQYFRE
ncbi:hypothetical protein [Vibrio mediterranei]|uniref:hypothetical protein n=1 Tax=Vibrio mediterranei TaxID=689 RepID=UPI0040678BC7